MLVGMLIATIMGSTSNAELDLLRMKHRNFLNAIASVESSNNDLAIGDGGRAIGRYQIWEVYWQDAVDFCPQISGRYANVVDKKYAERIVMAYLLRYGRDALKNRDYEKLSRIHNGGPKGYKKKATLTYWLRIKKFLVVIRNTNRLV
jgi:hypothetical protein